MNGEYAIQIKDGFFKGIWSNMAIKTTYMKVGKGELCYTLYSLLKIMPKGRTLPTLSKLGVGEIPPKLIS